MSASTSKASTEVATGVDATIVTGRGLLCGVNVITDNGGSNAATVIIYDNTASSGKKLYEGHCSGTERSKVVWFDRPVQAYNGIRVAVTGTGASAIIYTG